MIVNPAVSGTLSLNLKDVTVREALEAVREVYGYEFRIDGARIYVESAGLQTRVFQVNYLTGLRSGRSDVRVSSGAISGAQQGGGGAAAPGVAAAPGTPGQASSAALGAFGLSSIATASLDASRVSMVSQSDLWNELTIALPTLIGTGPGRTRRSGGRRGGRGGVWSRRSDSRFRRSDSVPGIAGKRPGPVQPAGCGSQQPESRPESGNGPILRDQRNRNSRTDRRRRDDRHPVDSDSQLVLFRCVPRHHASNRRGREHPSAYSSAGQQRRAAGPHVQFRGRRDRYDASAGEELHQRNRYHRPRSGREHRRPGRADEGRCRERPFRPSLASGHPGRRRIVREHPDDQDLKRGSD